MNSWCAAGLYCVRIRKRGAAETPDRNEPSMMQPVTELDARFTDRATVATDWDQTRRAPDDSELYWIATVRADGRPHVTPLVAVWLDDAIYFATGFAEQKAVNLRTNQNVILMTGCNECERGLDVVVEGEAVQVIEESVLKRLAEAWETKWDGRWQYEVHEGGFRPEANADAILVFAVSPPRGSRSPRAASARRATGSIRNSPDLGESCAPVLRNVPRRSRS